MTSREKIAASIIRFNRRISESIDSLERTIRDMDGYRGEFADQHTLLTRIELLQRVYRAAVNHSEYLRPRLYMIEEQDTPPPGKRRGGTAHGSGSRRSR